MTAGRGPTAAGTRASWPRGDDGNAMLEFTYLAVLLMVPLVYFLLSVFLVQRAAFGVTEAARQAGRAYALAADPGTGTQRAGAASALALSDQGISDAPPPSVDCLGECLAPGSSVRVTVTYDVELPVISALLPQSMSARIPVSARHVEVVDTFQQAR